MNPNPGIPAIRLTAAALLLAAALRVLGALRDSIRTPYGDSAIKSPRRARRTAIGNGIRRSLKSGDAIRAGAFRPFFAKYLIPYFEALESEATSQP